MLREFKVVEQGDPCDYPDMPDEFGNYPQCDLDYDYTPDGKDGVDSKTFQAPFLVLYIYLYQC